MKTKRNKVRKNRKVLTFLFFWNKTEKIKKHGKIIILKRKGMILYGNRKSEDFRSKSS